MWNRIGKLGADLPAGIGGGYEMFGVLAFLQHVPDRDRAREAFGWVGPLILDRELVALDPEVSGEVHGVLAFAPEPDSLARALFDDATVEAHLDHLARGQRDDGGWTFNWPGGRRTPSGTGAASTHRGQPPPAARQRPPVGGLQP